MFRSTPSSTIIGYHQWRYGPFNYIIINIIFLLHIIFLIEYTVFHIYAEFIEIISSRIIVIKLLLKSTSMVRSSTAIDIVRSVIDRSGIIISRSMIECRDPASSENNYIIYIYNIYIHKCKYENN